MSPLKANYSLRVWARQAERERKMQCHRAQSISSSKQRPKHQMLQRPRTMSNRKTHTQLWTHTHIRTHPTPMLPHPKSLILWVWKKASKILLKQKSDVKVFIGEEVEAGNVHYAWEMWLLILARECNRIEGILLECADEQFCDLIEEKEQRKVEVEKCVWRCHLGK